MIKYVLFFQVAEIQALSSRLEVKTSHLSTDLQKCERSRSELEVETSKQLQHKQKTHDDMVDYKINSAQDKPLSFELF